MGWLDVFRQSPLKSGRQMIDEWLSEERALRAEIERTNETLRGSIHRLRKINAAAANELAAKVAGTIEEDQRLTERFPMTMKWLAEDDAIEAAKAFMAEYDDDLRDLAGR